MEDSSYNGNEPVPVESSLSHQSQLPKGLAKDKAMHCLWLVSNVQLCRSIEKCRKEEKLDHTKEWKQYALG